MCLACGGLEIRKGKEKKKCVSLFSSESLWEGVSGQEKRKQIRNTGKGWKGKKLTGRNQKKTDKKDLLGDVHTPILSTKELWRSGGA